MLSIGHYFMNIGHCMLFTLVFVKHIEKQITIIPLTLLLCCILLDGDLAADCHPIWFLNDCSCHIWCGFCLGVWNICWLMCWNLSHAASCNWRSSNLKSFWLQSPHMMKITNLSSENNFADISSECFSFVIMFQLIAGRHLPMCSGVCCCLVIWRTELCVHLRSLPNEQLKVNAYQNQNDWCSLTPAVIASCWQYFIRKNVSSHFTVSYWKHPIISCITFFTTSLIPPSSSFCIVVESLPGSGKKKEKPPTLNILFIKICEPFTRSMRNWVLDRYSTSSRVNCLLITPLKVCSRSDLPVPHGCQ